MSRCPKCGHDANDSWEFVEFGDSFVAFSVEDDDRIPAFTTVGRSGTFCEATPWSEYRSDWANETPRPFWSRIWSKISGRFL